MRKLIKNLNYYLIDDVKDEKFSINLSKTTIERKYGMTQSRLRDNSYLFYDEEGMKLQIVSNILSIEEICQGYNEIAEPGVDMEILRQAYEDDGYEEYDRSIDYDYNYENDCEYDGDEEIYGSYGNDDYNEY